MLDKNDSDPILIGLTALAATLGDERRAQRFVDLTGIGTDELRQRATESSLLGLLRFLDAHEPDLLSVSEAIGIKPEQLVEARRKLEE